MYSEKVSEGERERENQASLESGKWHLSQHNLFWCCCCFKAERIITYLHHIKTHQKNMSEWEREILLFISSVFTTTAKSEEEDEWKQKIIRLEEQPWNPSILSIIISSGSYASMIILILNTHYILFLNHQWCLRLNRHQNYGYHDADDYSLHWLHLMWRECERDLKKKSFHVLFCRPLNIFLIIIILLLISSGTDHMQFSQKHLSLSLSLALHLFSSESFKTESEEYKSWDERGILFYPPFHLM